MADLSLHILLSAQDAASQVFRQVGSAAQSALGGMVVGAAAAAGVALVGLGAASVQTAADFQEVMLRVQALAGVSASEAKVAEQAIMQMSVNVGQAPKTLAEGLYYIASAGYSAKDSLTLLELSSKAAAVGNTQTEVTANALTAAMKAFNLPASEAGATMDMMVKTVSTGKTEFEDYAKIIGKVSLNAQQSGISFAEANAAFATLTNVMPSSKQAADSLNALLQTSSRFDLLSNRAAALGLTFDSNAYKTMNLQERMQYLMQITDGDAESMTKLLGRANAMAAATALASGNFEGYNTALKSVTNNQGALEVAFAKTSSGFNAGVARMKAAFDVLLITIGNALLPPLTALMNAIAPLIASFASWLTQSGALQSGMERLGSFLIALGNNWSELADMVDVGGISQAFSSLGATIESSLGTTLQRLHPFINNISNMFIHMAASLSGWLVPGLKIVEQVVAGASGAFQKWMASIATNLMPALENLVAAIAPVIQSMLEWIQTSGIIPMIFEGMSASVNVVIIVISTLINWIANIIRWLDQWVGIWNILKVTLAIALAPLAIAIGTVVIAIMAIVQAVQIVIAAWQAFPGWWSGIWSAVSSFFVGVWNGIVSFFIGAWNAIVGGAQAGWNGFVSWLQGAMGAIGGFFSGMWGAIVSGIQSAWNGVVSFFQGLWANIVGIFQGAVQSVVNAFIWLYQHNYYFQALVDTIIDIITGVVAWLTSTWQNIVRWITTQWTLISIYARVYWSLAMAVIQGVVSTVVGWLQGVWNGIVSFLTGLWNGIVSVATTAWNAVTGAISTAINAAVTWLQGVWTSVTTWLSDTWNNLVKGATDLWNQISTVFASAWNTYIAKPLTDLYNSMVEWASGLVTAALDWGKSLIQGFIDGITSMLGAVGEAAGNVVAEIGKFLGFHSPSESGPGAQADEWAPALIDMYAKGLTDGAKQIQVASQQLMVSMQITFQQGFAQLNVIVQQGVVSMTQTLSLSWTQMIAATTVGMQQVQLAMSLGWAQVALSVTTSLTGVSQTFTLWWTQTLLLFTLSFQKLTLLFQTSWQQILLQLQLVLRQILQAIQLAWTAILAYLTGMQARITTAITTPFKNAQTEVTNIMNQMKSSVTSSVNSMISSLNSVIAKANEAKAAASSVPSVPSSGGTASNFASGVENFTGGLAYVHEKEVLVNLSPGTSVVPANRVSFGKGTGAGANITNYITITVPRGRTDVEDIADEVSRVLAREFKGLLSTISTGGTSI